VNEYISLQTLPPLRYWHRLAKSGLRLQQARVSAHDRPSVHIVSNRGKITTQAHTVGQCWSSAILALQGRFVPLVW